MLAPTAIAGTPGTTAGARTRTSTGPEVSISAPRSSQPGSALRAAASGSPPTAAALAPARAASAARPEREAGDRELSDERHDGHRDRDDRDQLGGRLASL